MPKLARRVVGISGNMTRPSRTRVLVDAILAEIAGRGSGETASYDLLDAGPGLGTATSREGAPEALDRVWREIETCDVLVVGSPTYKGSYAGLLKHLFDLLDGEPHVGLQRRGAHQDLFVDAELVPDQLDDPAEHVHPVFDVFCGS